MHLFDADARFYGGNGIVGSQRRRAGERPPKTTASRGCCGVGVPGGSGPPNGALDNTERDCSGHLSPSRRVQSLRNSLSPEVHPRFVCLAAELPKEAPR